MAASKNTNEIYQFDRVHTIIPGFPISSPKPDGVVFGAEGTPFEGYFFVNSNSGWVFKITNDGSTTVRIAASGGDGDFVAVDTKGNLLVTQTPLGFTSIVVTRLSTLPLVLPLALLVLLGANGCCRVQPCVDIWAAAPKP